MKQFTTKLTTHSEICIAFKEQQQLKKNQTGCVIMVLGLLLVFLTVFLEIQQWHNACCFVKDFPWHKRQTQ